MKDLRKPENRRETFHDFYRFQLETKGHAGCVYFIFPWMFKYYNMTNEEQLWFVFLNGQTQNPITTWLIWTAFPRVEHALDNGIEDWYNREFKKLSWDTDRRHQKSKFIPSVKRYVELIGDRTQQEMFNDVYGEAGFEDDHARFRNLFAWVKENYAYFGRLSTFSYTEYLFIQGQPIDCDQLFLEDIKGSKSHRNGICKVLGRDDLEWTKENEVVYDKDLIKELSLVGAELLEEAKNKHGHPDTSYFTLETALCTYKGMHRLNRRYPGVYIDMMYDRIKKAEEKTPEFDFSLFWQCRKECVMPELLMEETGDIGVKPLKQNWYRETGEVVNLQYLYPDKYEAKYHEHPESKRREQITLF